MEHHTLTELIYSNDRKGSLALYIYGPDGRHSGRQYFAKHIRYPEEEIGSIDARGKAEVAMLAGHEVRITNGADFLIFHANGQQFIYPPADQVEAFWKEIGA